MLKLARPWSPATRAIYRAVGETFLPPTKPGDWHGGDDITLHMAERFYRSAPGFLRLAFFLAAWLFELAPILFGYFSRFSRLPAARRLKHMLHYGRTFPFALAFAPLRPFIGMSAYSRPDALAETGYSHIGLTHIARAHIDRSHQRSA